MSTIKIKNSTTPSSVPSSASLSQGELAVNIADKKLFVGNASGNPVELTNQGVLSINGATGAITNVAFTNLDNNFSAGQTFDQGLQVTSNAPVTVSQQILATYTTNVVDVVATVDGIGLRIAQGTGGKNSGIGGIALGRHGTTANNNIIHNDSGTLTIYNAAVGTGNELFDISTGNANFYVDVVAPVVTADSYRISSNALNAQAGVTYSLLTDDNGKIVTMDNASPITLTVPSGLPVGFNCTVIQLGAGAVGITSSGTTLNSFEGKLNIAGQHAAVSIISYSSNVFNVAGGLTG